MGYVTRVSSSFNPRSSSVEANEFHTEENSLSTSNVSGTPSISPGLSLLSTIKIVTMTFSDYNLQWLCLQSVLKKTKTINESNNKQSPIKQRKKQKTTPTSHMSTKPVFLTFHNSLPCVLPVVRSH